MKLHLCHVRPFGLVRIFSHLKAGIQLCRSTGMAFRPLFPESINSMTAGYNVYRTFQHNKLQFPESLIDVGANASQMTRLLLGMNSKATVLSFEPNPALTPLGDIRRLALSDTDGNTDFYVPHDDPSWGTIERSRGLSATHAHCFSVPMQRMDTLIETNQISWAELKKPLMVKIDTEGSEQRVLDGFGKYLSDIHYLLVEVSNIEQPEAGADGLLAISQLLGKHGFNRCKIVYASFDGPEPPVYCDILFWRT